MNTIFPIAHNKRMSLRQKQVKALIFAACFCLTSAVFAGGKSEQYPMGNHDLQGSRSQQSPTGGTLNKSAVEAHGLEIKWFTPTDHPVTSVPVTANGVVYVGTTDGAGLGSVYAIDAATGAILWNTGPAAGVAGGVLASPLIDGNTLYVGTLIGTMHALDRRTGAVRWSYAPAVAPPFDSIWSGPIKIRDQVIFAINPQDESMVFNPPGVAALIALDAKRGAATPADEIWRFTPVPANEQAEVGGAGIWGTSPSYSHSLGLIYVSTGQTTFSLNGGSTGSDSVFAIEADTGQVRWQNQFKTGDIWNFTQPFNPLDPIDMDVGEAPAVFRKNGKEYVAVGSKRGYFYVMDAATGEIINGAGMDAQGFKVGLDLFNGVLPGPGLDGGVNLDSGFFRKGNEVVHFGILGDYSIGMQAVANMVPPYGAGTCFVALLGLVPPCPPIDFGHLVLIAGDGSIELGRYPNPTAAVVSPVYLDDMVFVREVADLAVLDNDKLLVIDVSDPTAPALLDTVELFTPTYGPSFSLGAQISVSGDHIYTGNGFFGNAFFSTSGLYAIGVGN